MGNALQGLRDRAIVFDNGCVGRNVEIETANPTNYYQVISAPRDMPRAVIDAKLFVPPMGKARGAGGHRRARQPRQWRRRTSRTRKSSTNFGIAACVIDPFGARGVTSTVANQAQYSFAASAYDVLATAACVGATCPRSCPSESARKATAAVVPQC